MNQPLSSANPIEKYQHLMGRVDLKKHLDALIPGTKIAAPAAEEKKDEANLPGARSMIS